MIGEGKIGSVEVLLVVVELKELSAVLESRSPH